MPTATSFDELYATIGVIVLSVTGREWWRRKGMQSQPQGAYAVVYLASDRALEHQVVENVELSLPADNGEVFEQTPWGTSIVDCVVEFYRDAVNDTADQAATRFHNSLYMEKRFADLWQIAGLVGSVRYLDISGAFRADIEPRTQVKFSFIANIAEPSPLHDHLLHDIQSQQINVDHFKQDGTEVNIIVDVDSIIQ